MAERREAISETRAPCDDVAAVTGCVRAAHPWWIASPGASAVMAKPFASQRDPP